MRFDTENVLSFTMLTSKQRKYELFNAYNDKQGFHSDPDTLIDKIIKEVDTASASLICLYTAGFSHFPNGM